MNKYLIIILVIGIGIGLPLGSAIGSGSVIIKGGGDGGGVSDHGGLTGLGDDDHIQYILHTELDAESELESQLIDTTDVYTDNDFADNHTDWDTAYSWGDHSIMGYLLTQLWFDQDLNSTDSFQGNVITANEFDIEDSNKKIYYANENITIQSDKNISLWTDDDLISFEINDTGLWSSDHQSGCRARLESFQGIPNNVWTKLLLSVEDYDRHNDYDTLNMYFVAPKSGYYDICYSVEFTLCIGSGVIGSCIYKNSQQAGGYELSHKLSDYYDSIANSGSDILYLSKGDIIELYVYRNFMGGSPNCPAVVYSNYIAITKIA